MKSYWIWAQGDYEIYHTNMVNSRRQQYGMDYPAFWRFYDVDRNVIFNTKNEIDKDGYVLLHLNGNGYIKIDGIMFGDEKKIPVKKGHHSFEIHVVNLTGLPAAYIESDVIATDDKWYTCNEKKETIPVGFNREYDKPTDNPEVFPFSYKAFSPQSVEKINGGILYDFGCELFGFLYIGNVKENENIHISYGESREEALDCEFAVVQDDVSGKAEYKLRQRAFRYIFITGTSSAVIKAELEYRELNNH